MTTIAHQQRLLMPGIRFVNLPELDACDMPLWMAWRSTNDSPALHNLTGLVDEVFGEGGVSSPG